MRSVNSSQLPSNRRLAHPFSCWAAAPPGAAAGQPEAGYATTTLPDGTSVPMWGYSCGGRL